MRPSEAVPSGLSVRRALLLGTGFWCACVPRTPAQTTVPALATSATAAIPAATTPARHSTVLFEGGLLTVQASNSSLNGILREVARATGMKISGSVPEDRVFGTYGPADPQVVLATLLDGTGTNILIVSNEADKPLELVLTHRTGGVSPPNPNETADSSSDEDADDSAARTASAPAAVPATPRTVGQRGPQGRNLPGTTNQPSEVTQPVVFAPIGATTAPATATTTPVDPDDGNDTGTETVKTPQQIFEQLQNLQQAGQPAGTAQPPQ